MLCSWDSGLVSQWHIPPLNIFIRGWDGDPSTIQRETRSPQKHNNTNDDFYGAVLMMLTNPFPWTTTRARATHRDKWWWWWWYYDTQSASFLLFYTTTVVNQSIKINEFINSPSNENYRKHIHLTQLLSFPVNFSSIPAAAVKRISTRNRCRIYNLLLLYWMSTVHKSPIVILYLLTDSSSCLCRVLKILLLLHLQRP